MRSEELIKRTDLFVLDMDGTVYLGDKVFPQAVEFVKKARAHGRKVVYFTNNASKNKKNYYEKLTRMGFAPEESDILSSADVTADYILRTYPGQSIYLVGTPALEEYFTECGIVISEMSNIVVSSFDTTLTYEKLVTACDLLREGAVFISTHPDYNCPVEGGFIPDSGAINALITASTGREPRYFGKPYKDTAEYIINMFSVERERITIVGDRLYTDIALGRNNGFGSVLVLSGESVASDVTDLNCPDLVVEDIGKLIALL